MEERLKQLKLKQSEVSTEAEKELEEAVGGNEAEGWKKWSLMMKPEKVKPGKMLEK